MRVRVPQRPESDPARALDEAIRAAAQALGISPGMSAMIASHLFEQIALQLSRGRMVRITGFGMFATRWFRPGHLPYGIAVPTFIPARGLRQEVRSCVMTSQVRDDQIRRYRKRHRVGSIPRRSSQRTWTAQGEERRQILHRNFGSVELD